MDKVNYKDIEQRQPVWRFFYKYARKESLPVPCYPSMLCSFKGAFEVERLIYYKANT